MIQEMDLEIKHQFGHSNTSADTLSRNPVDSEDIAVISSISVDSAGDGGDQNGTAETPTLVLSEATWQKLSHVSSLQKSDPDLKDMFLYLLQREIPEGQKEARRIVLESPHFDLLDGTLHHENPHSPGRWCLAVPTGMRLPLMEDAHGGLLAGHLAERQVYDRLWRDYWWPGMQRDIRKHCRSCVTCATRKGTGHATHQPLQPINVGGPFHCMGVDGLQLPPTLDRNKYMVVFLDCLTKWEEAFAGGDQSAETITKLLVEQVICHHGAPQHLLSDRGSNFMSELMSEVCHLMGIKRVNTAGYHPQTNGLVERFHSTLISMLSKLVNKDAIGTVSSHMYFMPIGSVLKPPLERVLSIGLW